MNLYTVTWRLTGGQGEDRTTAIAADKDLSEEELKIEVAHDGGLAIADAVIIRRVTRR